MTKRDAPQDFQQVARIAWFLGCGESVAGALVAVCEP